MLQKGGQVITEEYDGGILFRVSGEIDHHSAVSIRSGMDEVILEKRPKKCLLELSGVDFMDSSGLGLMMGRYALVKQYGGEFAVVDPGEAVVKMMQLAGMERRIPVLKRKQKDKGEKNETKNRVQCGS